MSSRPYTARLYAGESVLERQTVPVPAGHRWVVRDVQASGPAPARVDVTVDGVGYLACLDLVGDSAGAHGHWTGRQAVYAGEQMGVWGRAPGIWIVVTGYDFLDG